MRCPAVNQTQSESWRFFMLACALLLILWVKISNQEPNPIDLPDCRLTDDGVSSPPRIAPSNR